jgi:molybdopterin converting factor small subunit
LADTQTSDVQGVLRAYFARHPLVQSYILDEQGQLRKHVTIFLNGVQIRDRDNQRERVALGDEIVVMQALSGG